MGADKADLKYQWETFMKLKDKPKSFSFDGDWNEESLTKISQFDLPSSGSLNIHIDGQPALQMQLKTFNIKGMALQANDKSIKLSNKRDYTIASKVKLNWKVQYRFKEID